MKICLIIKKTVFNDFLSLALACMVSLLFTQSTAQFYKNSKTKEEGCVEMTSCGSANSTNTESKSNKPSSGSHSGAWLVRIAVLNSSEPVFQIRDDFRFILNTTVNQFVTEIKPCRNLLIQKRKVSSPITFSIPIFHCQLLI